MSGRDIQVEFVIKGATYYGGGFLYRGVHVDINPTRIGVRDDTPTYQAGLESGSRFIALTIRASALPFVELDLSVDGSPVLVAEPIEIQSYSRTGIGFASPNGGGYIAFDDFLVHAITS